MNAERNAMPTYASEKMQHEMNRIARAGSPSEKRIAKYLSRNALELHGETAATLAEKLKLSPMTVGRFLRSLGFQELSELVSVLGAAGTNALGMSGIQPTWIDEESANPAMAVYLRQMRAIQSAFKLTTSPDWKSTIDIMTSAREIFITSGEQIFGSALHFYTQIAEELEGVSYIHASRAHLQFADTVPEESLLIIIDANDASELLQRLAKLADQAQLRTIVITTNPVAWAAGNNINVVTPDPQSNETDFDPVQLSSLMEMIVNAIKRGGTRPVQRSEKIAKLKQSFGR